MVTEARWPFRRGQAMIELAFGMFAIALVLSAVFGLVHYVTKSLDTTRSMRVQAGRAALDANVSGGYATSSARGSVKVEPFAAEYIFGAEELKIREDVAIPNMKALEVKHEE